MAPRTVDRSRAVNARKCPSTDLANSTLYDTRLPTLRHSRTIVRAPARDLFAERSR